MLELKLHLILNPLILLKLIEVQYEELLKNLLTIAYFKRNLQLLLITYGQPLSLQTTEHLN